MSAPQVVRTTDGMVWTRRAVTRAGLALYAPEGVCQCPEYVMATQAELAEHGLAVPAPMSRPLPAGDAACGSCGHDGAEHHHEGTKCWAHLSRGRRADGTTGPVRLCGCEAFAESPDALTRTFAPTQALREDSHDGPLHHSYRVPRDMPELGGAL